MRGCNINSTSPSAGQLRSLAAAGLKTLSCGSRPVGSYSRSEASRCSSCAAGAYSGGGGVSACELCGVAKNEVERSVHEISMLYSSNYHGGSKHMDSMYKGNDGSSLLAISVPRDDGSNIMTSPYITQSFDDRLKLAQETRVRAPVF